MTKSDHQQTEAMREERASNVIALRRFLRWSVIMVAALLVAVSWLAVAYDSRAAGLAAGIIAAIFVVYSSGLVMLRGDRFEAAVGVICGGLCLVPVGLMLLSSQLYPMAAVLTLFPVGVAVPFIRQRDLRWLMLSAGMIAVTSTFLALRTPRDLGLPPEVVRLIVGSVTSLMTGFTLALFWTYSVRLRGINTALRQSEQTLEAQLEELSRSQAALAEARDDALRANQAKSAFLANVSHELRTPLTSVLGFSKLIKKRLADTLLPALPDVDKKTSRAAEQVRANVDIIASEGERLTKLINEVLDLAKIEAGKLEWNMQPTTISTIIDQAANATTALFEEKPVTLELDVEDGMPGIEADQDRLIQVVINLISNAVKFTDEGSVTCRARRDDAMLEVSVIDTGAGIAEEDRDKIFEQFVQVGDQLTDKPQGTGLGLSISKQIVDHHGGRIWVDSELGVGTAVSFTIPLAADAAEPADTTAAADRQPIDVESVIARLRAHAPPLGPADPAAEKTILVVDDDAAIRELLRQELENGGYQVRDAADGEQALAEVRRERPDLIVLDVMMPGLSGFDVAAVLRNDPETFDIPIFILSVLHDEQRGYQLGVDRYFTKPLDSRALLDEIQAWTEQGVSNKRVLVVDEDASTVETLSSALETHGYTVVGARSGEEGIEKAISNRPDLVVVSSLLSQKSDLVKTLRFQKGLEQVYFLLLE